MGVFEFIALICFIFFGVIPLFAGFVLAIFNDFKLQEKDRKRKQEVEKYFLYELHRIRDDLEELKGD